MSVELSKGTETYVSSLAWFGLVYTPGNKAIPPDGPLYNFPLYICLLMFFRKIYSLFLCCFDPAACLAEDFLFSSLTRENRRLRERESIKITGAVVKISYSSDIV